MTNIISKQYSNIIETRKAIVWEKICEDIKEKLGKDIYESWIKKLRLAEELQYYIVLSAPTRFIRDWVVSRYLDQIIEIVKLQNKNISRVDFIIRPDRLFENKDVNEKNVYKENKKSQSNVTYIEKSSLAYTRIDPNKKDYPNYIYLIGSDKLSQELHDVSEMINKEYINLELDYTFNDENHPNRFYYRSDHYNFAKNNIPIIFYFNGVHEDYHKPTDTPDKIEYELMAKRAQLIFQTAWEVANREGRITADKL